MYTLYSFDFLIERTKSFWIESKKNLGNSASSSKIDEAEKDLSEKRDALVFLAFEIFGNFISDLFDTRINNLKAKDNSKNHEQIDSTKHKFFLGISEFFMSIMKNKSWQEQGIAFWDKLASFLLPLFKQRGEDSEECAILGPTDFALIVNLFKYRDKQYDYNYSGCLSLRLMDSIEQVEYKKLASNSVLTQFWLDTGLTSFYETDDDNLFEGTKMIYDTTSATKLRKCNLDIGLYKDQRQKSKCIRKLQFSLK